jgi:hypothetical protein
MPEPIPRLVSLSALAWFLLSVIGLPHETVGSASRFVREHDFPRRVFEVSAISLCSSLRVCFSPRSFLPLQLPLQGSRDVYVRAEHASLPSHASDMLSARLQAIGGTRTFTSQDSQPCQLLTFRHLIAPVLRIGQFAWKPNLLHRRILSLIRRTLGRPNCRRPSTRKRPPRQRLSPNPHSNEF